MNRMGWECVLENPGYDALSSVLNSAKSSTWGSEDTQVSRRMYTHPNFYTRVDSPCNKKLSISKVKRKASPTKKPQVLQRNGDSSKFLTSERCRQTRASELVVERVQDERKVVDTAQIFQLIEQFKCKYSALQKKYSKQEAPRTPDTSIPLRKVQTMVKRPKQPDYKQKSDFSGDQSKRHQFSNSSFTTKKALPKSKNPTDFVYKQSNSIRVGRETQKGESLVASANLNSTLTPTAKSPTPNTDLVSTSQIPTCRNIFPSKQWASNIFQVAPKRSKSKPYKVALSEDECMSDDDDDKESVVVHRFQIHPSNSSTNSNNNCLTSSSRLMKQSLCSSNLSVKSLMCKNFKNPFRKP